jgi:hypothetical protein
MFTARAGSGTDSNCDILSLRDPVGRRASAADVLQTYPTNRGSNGTRSDCRFRLPCRVEAERRGAMPIINILVGIILLVAGRRLFWLPLGVGGLSFRLLQRQV